MFDLVLSRRKVIDKYADNNGTYWLLCRANREDEPQRAAIFITSYLNTIHIRQRSTNNPVGLLNATVRVQPGETNKSFPSLSLPELFLC